MSEQLFTLPQVVVFDTNAALVSGAKANFYIAGTLTRQNTYTDSALTTPHANPVVADGNGLLDPIYLDATLNYKVDITDSLDSSLEGYPIDNITAALTATEVGTALWPVTTAETSAGVTPTNVEYEPGKVLRYGTNTTPGTTDMTAAFTSAVAQNDAGGASVKITGVTTYLVDPLNIDSVSNVTILGEVGSIVKAAASGNVFHITNSNNIRIDGVTIQGVRTYTSGTATIKLDEVDEFQITNNHVIDSSRMGITAQASEHGVIANNLIETAYQDGIMVRRGDDAGLADKSRHIAVTGNTIYNVGILHLGSDIGEGIHIFDAEYITVTGNSIYNSFNNGISLEGADNCIISANTIIDSKQSGISVNDGTVNTSGLRCIVTSNLIEGSGSDGIVVSESDDTIISNNIIKSNGGYGIQHGISTLETEERTIIDGNSIASNTSGGIILNWNSEDVVITNNVLRGTTATGILVNRSSNNNTLISNNNIKTFAAAQITDNGTGTVIRENIGYLTENKGTGSIASGTTADVITHGLAVTPVAADLRVTLTEDPTSSPGAIWVGTITSTQFTVNCENDPSTSNLDFSWKASTS